MKVDTRLFLSTVGDNNKYQIRALILACLVWGFCDLVGLTLGLLELRPLVSTSTGIQSLDYGLCETGNYKILDHQIKHSYVINYGIYCSPGLVSLIGVFSFLGVLTGTIFIPTIIDKIGRKTPLVTFVFLFGFIFLIYSFLPVNIICLYIFLYLQGISNIISHYSSYILISEIVNRHWRATYSTYILNSFTCFGIIYTWLLYFVEDLYLLKRILGSITIILSILIYYYMLESPRYLYVRGKFLSLDKVFESIAIVNNRLEDYNSLKKKTAYLLEDFATGCSSGPNKIYKEDNFLLNAEDKEILASDMNNQNNYQSEGSDASYDRMQGVNFLSLFKNRETRNIFLIMSFIWFTTSGIYYGSIVFIKVLPGNVYIASTVLYVAEIFSNILTNYMIDNHHLGRKGSYILCFALNSITLFVSIFFVETENMKSVFLVILRFLITTVYNINYIYSAEVYPTVYRALGLSYNSLFGRLGIIVNMLLLEVLQMRYFIFCLITCTFCCILSLFLKETHHSELKDFEKENYKHKVDDENEDEDDN
jgi:MFS family permease